MRTVVSVEFLVGLAVIGVLSVTATVLLQPVLRGWVNQHKPGGGFDCGLRVVDGNVYGLSSRWRHGEAYVEGNVLVWRRLPWRQPILRLAISLLREDPVRSTGLAELLFARPGNQVFLTSTETGEVELCVLARRVSLVKARLPVAPPGRDTPTNP
jgi:hypothetical protein